MFRRVVAAALVVCVATTTAGAEPRPRAWCGWFARFHLVAVDPGRAFNRACEWLRYGTRADGPAVGVLVVWCSGHHHHVGKIAGTDANGNFIVKSGNDGHAVRERVRSVAGASFRWPS